MAERKRFYIGVSCTPDEIKSLKLIQNNVTCAHQACSPEAIPDNVPREKAEIFIAGAIEAKSRALWLQDQWWNEALKKYQIIHTQENPVYVDFSSGEFYRFKE
jgi:hypothetical protein